MEGPSVQTQMVGQDMLMQAELCSLLCHCGQWLSRFRGYFCSMAGPSIEKSRGPGNAYNLQKGHRLFSEDQLQVPIDK